MCRWLGTIFRLIYVLAARLLGAELCKLSLQASKYIFVNVRHNRTALDIDTSLILKKIPSPKPCCNSVIYLKRELENYSKKVRAKWPKPKALKRLRVGWGSWERAASLNGIFKGRGHWATPPAFCLNTKHWTKNGPFTKVKRKNFSAVHSTLPRTLPVGGDTPTTPLAPRTSRFRHSAPFTKS